MSSNAPLINDLDFSLNVSENDTQVGVGVLLDGDVTVRNPDGTGFAGGHITLHLDGALTTDSFSILGNGIVVSDGSVYLNDVLLGTIDSSADGTSGHDLTVSFVSDRFVDRTEVSALLQSVYVHNSSDAPISTARNISLTVVDSELDVAATRAIAYTITPTADAPTISDLTSSISITEDQAQSMNGVQIDADVTFRNPDATGWKGGHVTLHLDGATANDSFTVSGSGVAVSEGSVYLNSVLVGTISSASDGAAGKDLTITFVSDRFVDRTEVNALMQSIYAHNSSDAPPSATRNISVTIVASDATVSTTQNIAYAITPTSDAPTISDLTASISITEDQAQSINGVQIDADVTFRNPDATGWAGGHLTLHLDGATATDSFTLSGSGIVVNDGSVYRNSVLVGTISSASDGTAGNDLTITFVSDRFVDRTEVNALMQSVYAHNSSDAPPSATRNISVTIVDSDATVSTTQNISYHIAPTNDAPVLLLPESLVVQQGETLHLGHAIVVDPDITDTLTVDLSVIDGVLSVSGSDVIVTGSGSHIRVTGTAAAINAIDVSYDASGGFTGHDFLNASVLDGHHGFDAVSTDIFVNAAPTLGYSGSTILQEAGANYSGTVLTAVSDAVVALTPADSSGSTHYDTTGYTENVSISGLYSKVTDYGTVTLNTNDNTLTYHIDDSLDSINSLAFNHSATISETVIVQDDNGGSASQTIYFTVHGANDAPVPLHSEYLSSGTYAFSVDENTTGRIGGEIGDPFGSVRATDPEGNHINYSLSGSGSELFHVNHNGRLSIVSGLDYEATSEYTFTVTTTDSHGLASSETVHITVNDVNDAPTISFLNNPVSATEDTTATNLGITVADQDGDNLTVVLNVSGSGVLGFESGTVFMSSESVVSGTLTLSGTAAEINADLAHLTYTDAANHNGTSYIDMQVTDSENASNTYSLPVSVASIDDAPTIEGTTFSVDENAVGSLAGIVINEVDGDSISVTVTVDHGTLSNDASTSANVSEGGSTIIVSGSVYDVNLYLAGLHYQGQENYYGADSLTVSVADLTGAELGDTENYNIDVVHVNQAPVVSGSLAVVTATEGGETVYTANALSNVSDVDGDTLSVVSFSATPGVTYNSATHTFALDPTDSAYDSLGAGISSSPVVVNYVVSDGNGHTVNDSVTFEVIGVNDSPIITVPESLDLNAGSSQPVTGISITDPDVGDTQTVDLNVDYGTLSVSMTSGVTFSSDNDGRHIQLIGSVDNVNAALATLGYASTLENGGTDSLTISTSDGNNGDDIQSFDINVNGHPVSEYSGSTTIHFNENVSGTVATIAFTDPNSDVITYSVSGTNESHFSINASTGELTFNGGNYESPEGGNGSSNSYSVTVVATDVHGAIGTQNIEVVVDNLNEQALVTAPETVTVAEDETFAFSNTISIADQDYGTVRVELSVDHGTLSDLNDTSNVSATFGSGSLTVIGTTSDVNAYLSGLTYRDDQDAHGSATLTIHTTDMVTSLSDNSQTQTVSISVTSVNDAPVISGTNHANAYEGSGTVTLGAHGNASDVDGDTLTVINMSSLPTGVTFDSGSQTFTFDPTNTAYDHLAAGTSEIITVNYELSDGHGEVVSDSVSFTIHGENDAPTLSGSLTASLNEGESSTLNGLSNVHDVDDNTSFSISLSSGSLPSGVTYDSSTHVFTLDANNSAYNHLGEGESQTVTVNYTVSDGNGGTVSDSAAFTISGVNDAPTVSGTGTITTSEDTAGALGLRISDVDSTDLITVTLAGNHVTLSNTTISGTVADVNTALAAITVTPDHDFNNASGSAATVTYTVSDGHIGTPLSGSIAVNITPVNDAPTVSGALPSVSATENGATVHSISALTGVSDVDNASSSFVVSYGSLPAGVTYDSSTHQFTLDPNNSVYNAIAAGSTQTVTVDFNVSDGAASVSNSVAFVVTGINDKPINTAAGTLKVAENVTGSNPGHTFTSGELSVSDADANQIQTVDVSVLHGTLTETGNASVVTGSAAHLKFVGTAAQINADLATLHYTPTLNYTGNDRLTISDKDSSGATDVDLMTISIITPPTFSGSTGFSGSENSSSSQSISASSTDGLTPTLSLSGADAAAFSISGSTIVFSAHDYETPTGHGANGLSTASNIYSVLVTATDHEGGKSTETVTFTVNNVNEAPVMVGDYTGTTLNDLNSSTFHTFLATDVDAGTTISYSISGTGSNLFAIDSGSGEIRYTGGAMSGSTTYHLTAKASDGVLTTADDNFDITIGHTAPTFSGSTDFSTSENSSSSQSISVSSTDGFTPTLSLSGADAAAFSISGSTIVFSAHDYETPTGHGANGLSTASNIYSVLVTATDHEGAKSTETVTFTVNNVNEAPVLVGDYTGTTLNDLYTGTVHTFSATDVDAGTTLSYSISGTGSNLFSIDSESGEISYTGGEMSGSTIYHLTAKASDGVLTTADDNFDITVGHAAPVISMTITDNVAENSSASQTITATSTDGYTPTLTLGGADQAQFELSGSQLHFLSQDYESPTGHGADGLGNASNTYSVTVTATDHVGVTTTQDVTYTVMNENDLSPVFANHAATFTVLDTDNGTVSGAVISATDDDNLASLIYSLSDSIDEGLVTIDSETGQISVNGASAGDHNLTVSVFDGLHNVDTTLTLHVDAATPLFADGDDDAVVINVFSDAATAGTHTSTESVLDGDTLPGGEIFVVSGSDMAGHVSVTSEGTLQYEDGVTVGHFADITGTIEYTGVHNADEYSGSDPYTIHDARPWATGELSDGTINLVTTGYNGDDNQFYYEIALNVDDGRMIDADNTTIGSPNAHNIQFTVSSITFSTPEASIDYTLHIQDDLGTSHDIHLITHEAV